MKHKTPGKLSYILDTSALVAYLAEERGGNDVKKLHGLSALPFITITELYYVTWRKQGQALADRVVHDVLAWKLPLLIADERLSISAGYLKGRYQLGIADSYVAAFALAHHATLITKDPDFRLLEPDLKLLFLP